MRERRSAFSIAIVCEAPIDREVACRLADRVVCESVDWITPESIDWHRAWRGLETTDPHLEWHQVARRARERNIKVHGHFGGEPGLPDAWTARLALVLLRSSATVPDAVLLIRDSDNDQERRRGLEQARRSAEWSFRIVVGVAHPKREAWALAGFEPRADDERREVNRLRKELGFDPTEVPERLTASAPGAKLNAKDIVVSLCRGDRAREAACWTDTELSALQNRGAGSGLRTFLDELRQNLVPLFGAG